MPDARQGTLEHLNTIIKYMNAIKIILLFLITSSIGCKDFATENLNNPDRNKVLSSGSDLMPVLQNGYVSWWQGVHGAHPAIALSVAADAYSLSRSDFGAQRFGFEPRTFYNNRSNEDPDYKKIVAIPWYGCLSAVSSANDVLFALDNGVSLDKGGAQDQAIRAAAHFLRGVSWGYIGLIFDQGLIVKDSTDITQTIPFSTYKETILAAEAELNEAITITESIGMNFLHIYFNGVRLDGNQFKQLSHSYAARFLAQMPRTEAENREVDWNKVLAHAEKGLNFNFAPIADGKFWTSYHQYVFAETGQGPLWARVDQRLIAALDPNQPARYPEVSKGDPPLEKPMATPIDARLNSDFVFLPNNNFPVERGEWHFSHYKHNRNIKDITFAGNDFSDGPMPAFRAVDNDLLKAEALLRLNRKSEAVNVINAGTRLMRGTLPPVSAGASDAVVLKAIWYERAIELLSTAPMSLWFDRRRNGERLEYDRLDALGGLQIGTPAHLPVPAEELRIRIEKPYNFGGERDPTGIVKF